MSHTHECGMGDEARDTVKSDAHQVAYVSLSACNPVFAFDTLSQAQTLTQPQTQT